MLITIGYVIGIIYGLYFKQSIAFIVLIAFLILKLLKIKYLLYKILKKFFIIIAISAIIGNTYILIENKIYNKTYKESKKISEIFGTIISNKEETNYFDKYIIVINSKPLKNKKYILYVKKNLEDFRFRR